jgi:hypothetical protein
MSDGEDEGGRVGGRGLRRFSEQWTTRERMKVGRRRKVISRSVVVVEGRRWAGVAVADRHWRQQQPAEEFLRESTRSTRSTGQPKPKRNPFFLFSSLLFAGAVGSR